MKTYRIERRLITTGHLWWKSSKPMFCIIEKESGKVFIPCWTDGGDERDFTHEKVVSMFESFDDAKLDIELWRLK